MIEQPTEAVSTRDFDPASQLYISEIFFSIQGEGTRAGLPCIFVRLQGCTLRCSWCDTKYALDHRQGGEWMSMTDIVKKVRSFPCQFVEFSGGEPLEQEGIYPLMKFLCDEGYEVAIETGGHVDARYVDSRVIRIIDVKCPDSKMQSLNCAANLEFVRELDEFKFVIASRVDYEFARETIRQHNLELRCAAVLLSPVFAQQEYCQLTQWMLEDALKARLQLQLHKFIWNPETRGV